ncbi:hypothetical protein RSAG8_10307, partial [Rhizoctonia solani AG-8 WAC10335]
MFLGPERSFLNSAMSSPSVSELILVLMHPKSVRKDQRYVLRSTSPKEISRYNPHGKT